MRTLLFPEVERAWVELAKMRCYPYMRPMIEIPADMAPDVEEGDMLKLVLKDYTYYCVVSFWWDDDGIAVDILNH